jgi:hypothetical protein
MTHFMCNPWKRTFMLVPLTPLTMFLPLTYLGRWLTYVPKQVKKL